MRISIISLCLIFCFQGLVMTSCQKVADYVDGQHVKPAVDSLAEYELTASDSACSPIETNGNFLVATSLTGSENVKLEVNVTKAGKWQYSSDTINGFSFSASGTFTNTGKENIILNGSGTPLSPGNYMFSLKKASSVLHVSIAVLEGDITVEGVPLKSYFKGRIGGIDYNVVVDIDGPDNIPYGFGSRGDSMSFASFLTPGIYPNPPGSGTVSLQKQFIYPFSTSTDAHFKAFFKPGAYPFVPSKCLNLGYSGIILSWVDSDGNEWDTIREFGDQSGSSFKIVGIEDGYDSQGRYFVKVKSRFNCKLYLRPGGQMQELTNGEMVSFFKRN